MARLTIYKDNNTDTTVVPNCFIDEYISEANDAQLKVYLYLLRMLNANQAISVSDIADKFNHTEKDVLRALKYWENKQLLSLDYDANGNLTGIRLCDLTQKQNEAAAPSHDKPSYEKPSYTTQELRDFKEREDTAQLLFIAQSYLGRPLTPAEMKSILFMMDVLHFSEDLIDYLIQYCVDRGKKDFKYIEKVAINWAEQGITTPKEAQKLSTKYDKNVYTIMNQLGKNSSPTVKELEFINRWTREWGFSNDIIFEACERTVLATDKHRFEYADSILGKWKKEDVHRKSDIIRMDEMYQARRRNAAKTITTNKFNQFTQNDYDFDQLERELLSN
ncbi:MAG: DnaD domain protein [Lachnospiraceae bacterium]|nr:DnaD domain protein [Lachnospiraceae bacterium]